MTEWLESFDMKSIKLLSNDRIIQLHHNIFPAGRGRPVQPYNRGH
jgi:hypothetical protein